MASKLIGRHVCPWCAFAAAHVKRSDRCLYIFCPGCGLQTHFRAHQEHLLLNRMRPEGAAAEPEPPAPPELEPEPAPSPEPEPPRPAAKSGAGRLFSGLGR